MRVSKRVLLLSLALTASGIALAATPGAGIIGTRHDFATRINFLGSQVLTPGVADVVGQCSFCHTPHSASSTSLLWNKTMSANTFTWNDATTTTGGTAFASMAPGYKGPTVKCLACHDGSVAVGDVAMYKGKVNPIVNTFKVGDQPTDYTGKTWTAADARPQYKVGAGGVMNGTHPVGMAYPQGQAPSTYNATTTGANVVLAEFQPAPHQVTPTSVGGAATTSLIKMYTDTGGVITAGANPGTTGMECSTCHDPHNKQTTDDWLLRGKNQGSTQAAGYICLQCHIK